jgi:hypothetical protein
MEDKEAIEVLTNMAEKKTLCEKEREAILVAIGALSWTKLGKARIAGIAKARQAEHRYDLEGRRTKIEE